MNTKTKSGKPLPKTPEPGMKWLKHPDMQPKTELPKKKQYKTPRMLVADAYTVGGDLFQNPDAGEQSIYYITFRRELNKIDPLLYNENDNRMIFTGLQDILEYLFYEPITHEEIDETKKFLSTFKANINGLLPYHFNEQMWREIVDNYNGRPPIKIEAMPEGSVVYPNEPVVQITSLSPANKMWGELGAYFESKLLHIWATSERATANRHWLKYIREMITEVNPDLSKEEIEFFASVMLHDFGDRAGITYLESEVLGKTHLYSFVGTDTVAGAYQAWKNGGEQAGIACSVYAQAHRTIQPWLNEGDAYKSLYDVAETGDFLSQVADCYDFHRAVKEYLLPLALKSSNTNEGKVIVARPDSGDALEQIMYVLNTAVENGLFTELNGYKYSTTLKVIEGDEMTWKTMKEIIEYVKGKGFAPHSWLVFGVGGGLRNTIKRDHFSAKYALCAVGNKMRPVIKLSEVEGKHTLPGPFKVLRHPYALEHGQTIVNARENGVNQLIEYFNGTNLHKPFGPGQDDDFNVIKDRIQNKFDNMPKTLTKKFPASNMVLGIRDQLVEQFG